MIHNTRLSHEELQAITDAIHGASFHEYIQKVGIFGSKACLESKGGDIDLLVEVSKLEKPIATLQWELKSKIWEKIGEQKIDIFVWYTDLNQNSKEAVAFYNIICKDIRMLWTKT
jgi:predicted nucleotidyltransferase